MERGDGPVVSKRMKTRVLALVAVAAATLSGACDVGGPTGPPAEPQLPPDTLPLIVSDSILSFSLARTGVWAGDTVSVFFTIRNPGSQPLVIAGSSSCTFNVRAYDKAGVLASPKGQVACTADIHEFATIPPGGSYVATRVWYANEGPGSSTSLAAGVYSLEPVIASNHLAHTGRRLLVQVVKR